MSDEIKLSPREQVIYEHLKKLNETDEGVRTLRALQRHYGLKPEGFLTRLRRVIVGKKP